MFERLLHHDEENAISILKDDHKLVKELFDRFEDADNRRDKTRIVAAVIKALKIHAAIEEEIFYPTIRRAVPEDVMNEADEEHHVAKFLIAELENLEPTDERFDAKFTVLAENVRHHIEEEEDEMLPRAKRADVDFDALGRALLNRKHQLMRDGLPPSPEEKMVRGARMTQSRPKKAKMAKKRAKQHMGRTSYRNGYHHEDRV